MYITTDMMLDVIFGGVNREVEALMNRQPPYQIGQLCDLVMSEKYSFDLCYKELPRAVNLNGRPHRRRAKCCGSNLAIKDFATLKMTPEVVGKLFATYEFINERIAQTKQ